MKCVQMGTYWYKNAIIYSTRLETFMDSNADGIGDFKGLSRSLDYLSGLGITSIWLLPFFPSPNRDHGYDYEILKTNNSAVLAHGCYWKNGYAIPVHNFSDQDCVIRLELKEEGKVNISSNAFLISNTTWRIILTANSGSAVLATDGSGRAHYSCRSIP
jgi:Alpha amylase, catalytic domain